MANIAAATLWHVYGYVYDGLLHFAPYQTLLQKVYSKVEVAPGSTLLDMGCGTGNMAALLLQKQPAKIVGVDLSASMLKIARAKLTKQSATKVECIQSDILSFLLTQPSGSYDCIVTVNVLYALGDRDKLWREMLRVCSPKGTIVIATSTSTKNTTLVKEQLQAKGLWRSLHPKLLSVGLIDGLIRLFNVAGTFEFPGEAQLRQEVVGAGGVMSEVESCYGGADILFTVRPA